MAAQNDTANTHLHASIQPQPFTSTNNGVKISHNEISDDHLASVLVKFLMGMPTLTAVNSPWFRASFETIVQHGPRCRQLLENPTVVQKTLWRFEHSMKQYMQYVIQSWNKSGCTAMVYSPIGGERAVVGFYCPVGFFFVEVPPSKQVNRFFNYYEIGHALKDLVPGLPLPEAWKDVVQVIVHGPSYEYECRYQARDLSDTNESIEALMQVTNREVKSKCVRQRVEVLWKKICKASKWVRGLVKKSDEIYEYVVSSDLYGKFYKTLKQKKTRLAIVMELESELKAWLSRLSKGRRFHLENDTDVAVIIENHEFWNDGNELLQALTLVFKIPRQMDTLVPSAGDLGVVITKAKRLLKTYAEHQPMKFKDILDCFEDWRVESRGVVQDAASYLHPAYILDEELQEKLDVNDTTKVWGVLYDLAPTYTEDEEYVFDMELEKYSTKFSNPFRKVPRSELQANHPIMVWSKYGARFPYLQKCAYKLLSQPSCCLCEQVEKHMYTLERSDNYMLRLNSRMIEEFRMTGSRIYQPMGLL